MKPLSKQPAIHYAFYSTSYGTGAIIFNQRGVKSLLLPQPKEKLERELRLKDCENRHRISYNIGDFSLSSLRRALSDYFTGRAVKFDFLLDLSEFSQFERDVYGTIRKIPYGEVKSYQEVAKEVSKVKASRAVGNALAKNPIPVMVPCHRVVGKNSRVGGFSAGLDWKKRLLELEKKNG